VGIVQPTVLRPHVLLDAENQARGHQGHGKQYTTKEREEAFWHETIHTCLYDMGVPVQDHDEKFVQALAVRLTQVSNSAEL